MNDLSHTKTIILSTLLLLELDKLESAGYFRHDLKRRAKAYIKANEKYVTEIHMKINKQDVDSGQTLSQLVTVFDEAITDKLVDLGLFDGEEYVVIDLQYVINERRDPEANKDREKYVHSGTYAECAKFVRDSGNFGYDIHKVIKNEKMC